MSRNTKNFVSLFLSPVVFPTIGLFFPSRGVLLCDRYYIATTQYSMASLPSPSHLVAWIVSGLALSHERSELLSRLGMGRRVASYSCITSYHQQSDSPVSVSEHMSVSSSSHSNSSAIGTSRLTSRNTCPPHPRLTHSVSPAIGTSPVTSRKSRPSESRLTLSCQKSDFLLHVSEHNFVSFSSCHQQVSAFSRLIVSRLVGILTCSENASYFRVPIAHCRFALCISNFRKGNQVNERRDLLFMLMTFVQTCHATTEILGHMIVIDTRAPPPLRIALKSHTKPATFLRSHNISAG